MAEVNVQFSGYLKSHGYSVTKPRRILFELLNNREPLGMRELCDAAAYGMDRASVYRTIEIFEKIGLVHRIAIGWKYKLELSDAFAEHHHHLACLNCKKIIPINENALESFIDGLAVNHRFHPTEHQIEIQGFCENCAHSEK